MRMGRNSSAGSKWVEWFTFVSGWVVCLSSRVSLYGQCVWCRRQPVSTHCNSLWRTLLAFVERDWLANAVAKNHNEATLMGSLLLIIRSARTTGLLKPQGEAMNLSNLHGYCISVWGPDLLLTIHQYQSSNVKESFKLPREYLLRLYKVIVQIILHPEYGTIYLPLVRYFWKWQGMIATMKKRSAYMKRTTART